MADSTSLHIVSADEAGMRLDAMLGMLPDVASRAQAAKLIEAGSVLVDGESQQKRHVCREGEVVEYPPVLSASAQSELEPQNIPLDIRYEDEHLIVLSKQAGLVCHPAVGHESGTLANALLYHCGKEHLGMLQGELRPGIVHRLDKDTSGLMLAAKDDETQEALQGAIRLRSVDRRYLALLHGYIAPNTGLIDAPIARSLRDRQRMAVSDDPGARGSITTFTVLERFEAARSDDGYTLVECKLYTGRTHQIRVHMQSIGHPCAGDALYCKSLKAQRGKGAPVDLGLTRQFLHSYRISFEHPATGVRISCADALPWDLAMALDGLCDRSMGRTRAGERVFGLLSEMGPEGLVEFGEESVFDDAVAPVSLK